MTQEEMRRRLAEITAAQWFEALAYAKAGNSARAVARDAGITLKQANAVFQWLDM